VSEPAPRPRPPEGRIHPYDVTWTRPPDLGGPDAGLPGPADGLSGATRRERRAARRAARDPLRSALEWVVVLGGALIVALLIRAFLVQAFYIPSESMEPTLRESDRVLVNKLSYDLHEVNRGDVVVFHRPPSEPAGGIDDLIKRAIGLGGETIEGRDGRIWIDDRPLIEPYLTDAAVTSDFGPLLIPEDHVFVMGDNRQNSRDSRFFGPIDEDLIVGRAFVRVWPVPRVGLL